jgi:hypothetical protein
MFTKRTDEKGFTHYEFSAGGYNFYVFRSKVGYWTVYRQERGMQLRGNGKTFWDANKMIGHYKTAASSWPSSRLMCGRRPSAQDDPCPTP